MSGTGHAYDGVGGVAFRAVIPAGARLRRHRPNTIGNMVAEKIETEMYVSERADEIQAKASWMPRDAARAMARTETGNAATEIEVLSGYLENASTTEGLDPNFLLYAGIRKNVLDGPRLTKDGDVRYYTFDNGVELFPIVRLDNESFTDTATRTLGKLDLDLVVNGALYGFTDGGSYPPASLLMPIEPDSTLTQGRVVGAGVLLAGRSAPDMAYFAKVVQSDGSVGYQFGMGDPPIKSSLAAFGGAMPLIIDDLPYGEINLYSGAAPGAPRTGDPGRFGDALTQRSNATFSSFVDRYERGGDFSTGKVIVAYNSHSGAFTVVVQPDGASSGRSLSAIRNHLRGQGYDNAVAFDGSSSASLVTPRGTVISPASYKNNTIGTGIGFRMPRVTPQTKPHGT